VSNRYCSYSYATVDGVTLTAGMWNGAFAAMLAGFDAVQADVDGDKANQVRYSGLTANYNAAGYRITGAGNGVNPQDYVTMAQLTATAFSPALPTQSGNAGRAVRTTGASAYWATDSASAQTMAYNGNGQLTGITETVDGYSKSTSYTYNSDGTLNTEAITMHGVTRTRTYSYSNGQLTGSTEV
jgi:YD repeat-containing protein